MKYSYTATVGILAAALLAAALCGCEPSRPVTASAGVTASVGIAATASVTAQPTATATVTPAPTAAETATAAPTQPPAVPGLPPKDYYKVERNQRAGIVDKNGKEVLPCVFGAVEPLGIDALENGPTPAEQPDTQFFLASAYDIHPASTGDADGQWRLSDARLYDAQGLVVGEGQYASGYWLDHDLMALRQATGDHPAGVLDVTGKQVVPFQYSQVVRFGPYVVGCNAAQGRLDFYKTDGVLDKTITAAVSDVYETNGYLEVYCQAFTALLNGNLQWLFKDSNYQSIQVLEDNRYIAYDGPVAHLIDSEGRDLLGKAYQTIEPILDANGQIASYVCCSEALATVATYDASGKLLFEKKGYTYLRAIGPYFIASFAEGTRVLDAKGEQILPDIQGNVQIWAADPQVFMAYDKVGNLSMVMRPDGTVLPLPKGYNIQYLGGDRFLVSVDATHTGVCDSQGHWVIPADYQGLYQLNSTDQLLTATLGEGRTGILDYDGNTVIPPVFDWIYGQKDGLLNARKGSRSGLMDWTGHWVWSTSDYDELDD